MDKQREKLIELLDELGVTVDVPANVDEDGCGTYEIEGAEYVADHLLANGVIVPPCKVGDTVYYVKQTSNIATIIMCEVEVLRYGVYSYARIRPCGQRWIGNQSEYYKVALSSFGKTIFLSRELAEEALNEQKKL